MKKLIAFTLLSILLSCGTLNRTVTGSKEIDLIKTVSIEQNCKKENIKIIEKVKKAYSATYALDVCGKRMVYKQVGTVFMESSKADRMVKSLINYSFLWKPIK